LNLKVVVTYLLRQLLGLTDLLLRLVDLLVDLFALVVDVEGALVVL